MTEREKEEIRMAGHSSSVAHVRTAMNGSTSEQKNLSGASAWKRIGRLEKQGEGVKITFTDPFGASHVAYVTRQEVRKITADRMPGDVVTISETPTEVITEIAGRAFRSRTGRALMIRVPWYSGDLMTPWAAFQKVMEGTQPAAPVSIVQVLIPGPKVSKNHAAGFAGEIRSGLQGGF
jgi:hypothetical protein